MIPCVTLGRRTTVAWLVTAFICVIAFGAEPEIPERLERPYLKLFTLVGEGQLADLATDENVEFAGKTYGWINSHGGAWQKGGRDTEYFAGKSGLRDARGRTVGERLRALNPSIILTNYRNGAYTNQFALHEAMEVERDCPLGIAVYDTEAKLAAPLAANATSIRLRRPSAIPEGQPAIYPFKASTAKGEHTTGKQSYVFWIRLGDEMIRVDAANAQGSEIVLAVKRGIWRTKAQAHGADAVVLAPVYCGSVRKNGEEYYLSGLIDGKSPQPAVRYVLQQQDPGYWKFLGDKMQGIIDEGVFPWFDCSTSSWINHSNGYGVRLQAAYDLENRQLLTRDQLRENQQRKFDALFKRFSKVEIYVNWNFPQWWMDEGHERYMFTGENGHTPLTGGVIEMYANPGNMEWLPLMKMQLDVRDRNLRMISWIKQHGTIAGDDNMTPQYMLFGYCTHLLVHEPAGDQYWGGAWELRPPYGRFTPPDFVYWNLGAPKQRFKAIEQALMSDAPGVYRREYEKGFVLVNPDGKATRDVTLPTKAFDAASGKWVTQVTLVPRSAALLLHMPTAR